MLIGQIVTFAILFCGLMMNMEIPITDKYPENFFMYLIIGLCLCPALLIIYTVATELSMLNATRKNVVKAIKLKRQQLSDGAAGAKRRMSHGMQTAYHAAENTVHKVEHAVESAAHTVEHAVENAAHSVEEGAHALSSAATKKPPSGSATVHPEN